MNQPTWAPPNIPDQTGRIAIVTGATSGTGLETAKALAARGATVVLACRNAEKTAEVIRGIKAENPKAQVEAQDLDLGSLKSVREAAASIRDRFDQIDLLINNAGVMVPPYGLTEDGFETQIGTNHFGPFVFTGLLLDRLQATPGSRVVTMSSGVHRIGQIHFEDLHFKQGYRPWAAYGQSKLANLLFTFELQRRLAAVGSGTVAVAAHPGWARTELQRHTGGLLGIAMAAFAPYLSQDAKGGAMPLLRAATDPAVQGGEYFGPSGFLESRGAPIAVKSSALSLDADLQRRLWRCSEENTGVTYAI